MRAVSGTQPRIAAFFLMLLMLLSGFVGFSLFAPEVARAATTSCPANSTLNYVAPGGTPNALNMLTASTDGAFSVENLVVQGVGSVYPFYSDSGKADNRQTVVSWVKSNSNYTDWTFNVKPGLKWSDGTPVTAADLIGTYSLNFSLNPAYDSDNAHSFFKSAKVLNATAAEFMLNASNAHWDAYLGSIEENAIYPPLYYKNGPTYTGFNAVDPSLAPWYPANYSVGQPTMDLPVNPYYTPQPGLCKVHMIFVETDSQTPTFLLSGQADLGLIEAPSAGAILSNPNLHIYTSNYHVSEALSYNITVYPYNMSAFRQALAYGINQSDIGQHVFSGYYNTAYDSQGGLPPVDTQYYNGNQQKYSFDTNKALSLLASMGIKPGSDKLLHFANGTAVKLNLWADDAYLTNILTAENVQGQLQSLGFTVDVHTTTYSNLASYWSSNVFGVTKSIIVHPSDGYVYTLTPQLATPQYGARIPSFEYNMATFEWPPAVQKQFDANATAYNNSNDPATDLKALQNIQAINAANLPLVGIGYPQYLWVYSTKHITNWPTKDFYFYGHQLNDTELALLQPLGASTTSTAPPNTQTVTSTAVSTTTSVATTTLTGSGATSVLTSTSTVVSTTSTGLDTSLVAGIAVVVAIVVAAVVFGLTRLRRKP